MKRLIPLLLAALLLCGCTQQPQETEIPTVPSTTEYVPPTEPAGSYIPESDPEQQSQGAVRAYEVSVENGYALAMAGENILLFSGLDRTVLTLLAGENLYTAAQTSLDIYLHPEDPGFRITENGITYYDSRNHTLVYLDEMLQEVRRLPLPEGMTGSPILSENRLKLYYCTADALRVLDLETGLDRLLKEMNHSQQYLEGILMNDSILYCVVTEEDTQQALFLSAQTGELLGRRDHTLQITSWEDSFYVKQPEGILQTYLFGTDGEELRMLNLPELSAEVTYLENRNAALAVSEEDESVTLDYYRLDNGLRSGAVTLTGIYVRGDIKAATESGRVSFLADRADGSGQILCRWDPLYSPTGDEANYTTRRYTLEDPDEVGLEECMLWAQDLSRRSGLEVLIGMDAVAVEPWDYELYPEYQVPVIRQMLTAMEQILAAYPEGFFETLSMYTTERPVKICLVRSLSGSPESGSLEKANGIQFWHEEDVYVAVAAGDLLQQTFCHEIFHVVETCVFSHSNAYDSWNDLNPKGFEYDYDYGKNLERTEDRYLQDEDRAFIDIYSMSYPKEDRARIMEYAVMEGKESYFLSDTMQAKLKALCKGIRETFDLRQYPNVLLWEQYLKKPLTP